MTSEKTVYYEQRIKLTHNVNHCHESETGAGLRFALVGYLTVGHSPPRGFAVGLW